MMLATSGKSEDTVEAPVSLSSDESGRIFTISDFLRTEYKADTLNNEHSAQNVLVNDPAHFEAPRAMIR